MCHAQLPGRVFGKVINKIADKIEDKIVEKISDEVAKAAYRPVDAAIDDMFRERFKQDSLENRGQPVDYRDFMTKMLQPVDLPNQYVFDIQIFVETKDYDKDKNKMTILMSKSNSIIGIKTNDDGKKSTVVFDSKSDIMAIYTVDNNGNKQVSAFPSMIKAAANHIVNTEINYKIEATGKTKKIANYQCEEWKIEDDITVTKAYIAKDFPASWAKSFSEMFKNVSPSTKNNLVDGMVLKSESNTKKKSSTYEAKKVIEEKFIINNNDYKNVDYGKGN